MKMTEHALVSSSPDNQRHPYQKPQEKQVLEQDQPSHTRHQQRTFHAKHIFPTELVHHNQKETTENLPITSSSASLPTKAEYGLQQQFGMMIPPSLSSSFKNSSSLSYSIQPQQPLSYHYDASCSNLHSNLAYHDPTQPLHSSTRTLQFPSENQHLISHPEMFYAQETLLPLALVVPQDYTQSQQLFQVCPTTIDGLPTVQYGGGALKGAYKPDGQTHHIQTISTLPLTQLGNGSEGIGTHSSVSSWHQQSGSVASFTPQPSYVTENAFSAVAQSPLSSSIMSIGSLTSPHQKATHHDDHHCLRRHPHHEVSSICFGGSGCCGADPGITKRPATVEVDTAAGETSVGHSGDLLSHVAEHHPYHSHQHPHHLLYHYQKNHHPIRQNHIACPNQHRHVHAHHQYNKKIAHSTPSSQHAQQQTMLPSQYPEIEATKQKKSRHCC